MRAKQLHTKDYRHKYFFEFKGKLYPINSYVKLTQEGKKYLETTFDNVQLTQHFFIDDKGLECWTFVTDFIDWPVRPFRISTDKPLEELIEEVIQLEPQNSASIKVQLKDWEVPDVVAGWICFAIFFIMVEIFKDWSIKLILRIVVGWYFGLWRQRRMLEEGKFRIEKDSDDKMKK